MYLICTKLEILILYYEGKWNIYIYIYVCVCVFPLNIRIKYKKYNKLKSYLAPQEIEG